MYTFENAIRAGILFNIGGGYLKGGGDFNSTRNNMSFWGLGAYAGWNKNNFALTADIDYTSTYNKLRQDVYGMGDFDELKADIPAWAISSGLRAEYKILTNYADIIPHLAFRYNYINMESYDIKNHGTVISGDSMQQNIWTFPLGVTLSKDFSLQNGWNIKPLVDFNLTPATGDIEAKNNIRFTGFSTEAELKTKVMDYVTYGGTAGIEINKNNFNFGINYAGQFGAESSSHGLFGTFRYEF